MDCASTYAIQIVCLGSGSQNLFPPGFREPLASLGSLHPIRPALLDALPPPAFRVPFSRPSTALHTPAVPHRAGSPRGFAGTSFAIGSRFVTRLTFDPPRSSPARSPSPLQSFPIPRLQCPAAVHQPSS